jgi:hypothetical protein
MPRDDFSERTKRTLRQRVSDRCSNPDCRVPTSAAKNDSETSITIGVAAHITSAEARLGRSINPTVQSLAEWKKKLAAKNAFTVKVNAQPKRFVIGDEASLE